MMRKMRQGTGPSLVKDGSEHLSGKEQSQIRNCQACKQLSDITRSSFGPNGMNKLIVNYLDKIYVTSDTATIMKEMEVQHPAAKMVTMASHMQEQEVGDGSNFVICFAGELLAAAEDLIKMGLPCPDIISGYEKACKKALEISETITAWNVPEKELLIKENLVRGAYSAISSKQFGFENFLAPLVAEACLSVMPTVVSQFNVDNVRVIKLLGGNASQSEVIKGMVFPTDTIGSTKKITDAKIAVFTCGIHAAETETKGNVLITSADELLNYSATEEREIEKLIKSIADSGVKVIVTGSTVDDLASHYIEKYGLMCVKLTSKFELRRLCRTTKARALVALGRVGPESQGYCSSVYVKEIGLRKVTVFQQESKDHSSVATVVLRGSTNDLLNDLERAVDDGVNVIRMMGRDGRFLAGAGASEIEIARQLTQFGAKTAGLEQYAIKRFAQAFEFVPRTLSENAGLHTEEIMSALYAAHENGQTHAGLNIDDGTVADLSQSSVLDLLATKQQALKLATDAATTILRVDQIIMSKPAGGPKMPQNQGHWDDRD